MKYVEFIVFIARVSFEVFKKTRHENLALHYKIDKVLRPMLGTIFVEPILTYKDEVEEEDEEEEVAKKK